MVIILILHALAALLVIGVLLAVTQDFRRSR